MNALMMDYQLQPENAMILNSRTALYTLCLVLGRLISIDACAQSTDANKVQTVLVCCEGMKFSEKEGSPTNARQVPWEPALTAVHAVYSATDSPKWVSGKCKIIRGNDTIPVDMEHLEVPGSNPQIMPGDIVWIEPKIQSTKSEPPKIVLVCGRGMTLRGEKGIKTNQQQLPWTAGMTVIVALYDAYGDFNEFGGSLFGAVEILRGEKIIRLDLSRSRRSSRNKNDETVLEAGDVVVANPGKEGIW
jgi:hypothetical protein